MKQAKAAVQSKKLSERKSQSISYSNSVIFIWLFIGLLFLSQVSIIVVFIEKENSIIRLNEEINKNTQDMQNQINILTQSNIETKNQLQSLQNSLGIVSTAQNQLQKQLSEIKAVTSSDFSGIVDNEIKGVVAIRTNVGQGSGFLITNDGYIVTNAHVLSGARYATIYTYDGERYGASLIGYDIRKDIALLKINGNFQSLELGDSDETKIGEKVIALGNPLGLSFTVTEGIISARDRKGTNDLPYYFQTDASLNPGNSGGPLINTQGEVIGINNFKISGAENIGFALEINYAKEAINEIAQEKLNQTII